MKFIIIFFLVGTFSLSDAQMSWLNGPVGRRKRQVPLFSTTTTTVHQQPMLQVPVIQPVVVREFVQPEPIVQKSAEMPHEETQVADRSNLDTPTSEHPIIQENLPVQTNSEVIPQEHMNDGVPVVSTTPVSTTSFSSVDIISPGLNQESTRSQHSNNHELDPHLNGQSFPSILPMSQGNLPMSQGILPLNQGILPFNQGNILPLTQGLQGLFGLNQNVLPLSPIVYRSFPIYNQPIFAAPHPAYRQFSFPTTTVAPDSSLHQTRDNFPVKGGNVRSGVKGGMGTRSGVKGF